MYRHGPTGLDGPVSRNRRLWKRAATQPKAQPPMRTDLIERVRAEIAAGTYETPEKWQAALERLLGSLEWV
jgi:hypothetical protein